MSNFENAVSPVVGVMLMLVVTIIIAAVVSAFAGGLSGTQQKAPNAVLDVEIHALENAGGMPSWGPYYGYYVPTLTIKEVSGDTIPTKDLKIVTYFTNTSGSTIAGNLSGQPAVNGSTEWNAFGTDKYSGVLVFSDQNRFNSTSYVQDSSSGYKSWFGNSSAILRPGDFLTTPASYCGNYDDNTGPTAPHINPAMNYIFGFNVSDSSQGFVPGASVDVKIIHIPSGKAIFDKAVTIE
ncbi:MAG: type IV pilin N-terminal domain-containing protein [Methanoregulaceae archaeon]